MKIVSFLLLLVCIGGGFALQCYSCHQHQINLSGICSDGYCGLTPITCEKNQTACYIYSYLDGSWDNVHYKRGCTDDPDGLCKNLKATKYISSLCHICEGDKCNYQHVAEVTKQLQGKNGGWEWQ